MRAALPSRGQGLTRALRDAHPQEAHGRDQPVCPNHRRVDAAGVALRSGGRGQAAVGSEYAVICLLYWRDDVILMRCDVGAGAALLATSSCGYPKHPMFQYSTAKCSFDGESTIE